MERCTKTYNNSSFAIKWHSYQYLGTAGVHCCSFFVVVARFTPSFVDIHSMDSHFCSFVSSWFLCMCRVYSRWASIIWSGVCFMHIQLLRIRLVSLFSPSWEEIASYSEGHWVREERISNKQKMLRMNRYLWLAFLVYVREHCARVLVRK